MFTFLTNLLALLAAFFASNPLRLTARQPRRGIIPPSLQLFEIPVPALLPIRLRG